MSYRVRHRRPNKSGPMIKMPLVIMVHDGGGIYEERDAMGYAPSKHATFAAAKPPWSKFWTVIHVDSGFILRRAIKTADSARIVVERMQRYWDNCDWDTLMENNAEVQRDLYYEREGV